ncbi:Crp/Fnr family transcriptional regulator [uncultured Chryseobacterium sp.]|uniref:Crp/Fnr family transcriptional regulator n=1 Tax=uncultured Chryseobacterium sp. TaxID=259322 RepID=UPI0025E8B26A|nr:Crp/Fnr family transcriptional regulator [uncultured Chryseobacterium sp.]
MVISEDLLFSYGAVLHSYGASEFIFREGTISKFYFQIKTGFVKVNNLTEKGSEFIHGIPFDGHCFGESYLFTDMPYGISAVAVTQCEVIRLEKGDFLKMLSEMPDLFPTLYRYTAERLHFRYLIA